MILIIDLLLFIVVIQVHLMTHIQTFCMYHTLVHLLLLILRFAIDKLWKYIGLIKFIDSTPVKYIVLENLCCTLFHLLYFLLFNFKCVFPFLFSKSWSCTCHSTVKFYQLFFMCEKCAWSRYLRTSLLWIFFAADHAVLGVSL